MKVLIVKTSSMGDVIHTFQALEDARRARPDIVFDWCVEEPFAPLVRLHPAVAEIHTIAIRRWRKALFARRTWRDVAALRRTLREARYDLVLDAQGLMKSALVAKMAGAPIAGFDRASVREALAARFYAKSFAVPRDLHAVERTRRLFGQVLGYRPDLGGKEAGITAPAPPPGIDLSPPTAFLLHGTSRADKKWATADWIETARLLSAKGVRPATTFSNADEEAVARAIAAAVPETLVIRKSPLDRIAAILGHCAMVIGADTGLTHLASAFGLPTVAIFLSTEPGLTGPVGPRSSTLLARPGKPVLPVDVVAEVERMAEK
ncbi:MAG: lipopolysaccharide heptosyltransferase I [Rhizobiaceae bacterium]